MSRRKKTQTRDLSGPWGSRLIKLTALEHAEGPRRRPAKSDANQNYSTLSNASSREIELNFIQFESDLDEQVESDCSGTQILTREIVFFFFCSSETLTSDGHVRCNKGKNELHGKHLLVGGDFTFLLTLQLLEGCWMKLCFRLRHLGCCVFSFVNRTASLASETQPSPVQVTNWSYLLERNVSSGHQMLCKWPPFTWWHKRLVHVALCAPADPNRWREE